MSVSQYLPSAKLVSIALSLALSVGLVFAADHLTRPSAPAQVGVDSTPTQPTDSNWEAALYAVQAQTASSSIVVPDQNLVSTLLQAVQSPNLTDTVGKSLLINLTNAKSQGLGDDVPTQDQIVAAAAAQIKSQQASPTSYTFGDLTIVTPTKTSLHDYGNAVMVALSTNPSASERATFVAIDLVVEGHDASQATQLATIGAAYAALAKDLAGVPVPQTLAPLHLLAVNNLLSISATYADMEAIGSDPVRGLVGFKTYEALMDEGARVFTNIAQALNKDGILFTKDEPGSAWSIFITPTASPGASQ